MRVSISVMLKTFGRVVSSDVVSRPRWTVFGLLLPCLIACTRPALFSRTPPTFDPVNADPTQVAQLDPSKCYFFAWGIGTPFHSYSGPDMADQETTLIMVDVEPYEIAAKSEDRYQLDMGDDGLVWVNQLHGIAQGNCADIPLVRTRPEPPENICTIRYNLPEDNPVYDEPGGTVIATMPWGEYIEVIAAVSGSSPGYKVRLGDGTEGYVHIPEQALFYYGTISGPCEDLPVEVDERPGG